MALNSIFSPTLVQGGFIGNSLLRGLPETSSPTKVIRVKSKDIKVLSPKIVVKQVKSRKKRKSRLGPYGRYLF